MSVYLAGGGDAEGGEFDGFAAEASVRARSAGRARPRLAIVAIGPDAADAEQQASRFAHQIGARLGTPGTDEPSLDAVVTAIAEGETVPSEAFADVDGVVICGGRTLAYREALEPRFGELRRQVAAGVPYLGWSAGSMIAAERAIVGGWRIGGVEVAPASASDDVDEVTVAPGIGLVDIAIDVHAAQWGTVSRLVAAVEAGIVEGGLAIDERTVLVVGDGGLTVVGAGSVWRVLPGESGVSVSTMGA